MRIAFFDCFSGASGDMLLGSLLDGGGQDASMSLEELQADLAPLGVGGFRLEARRVTRLGLTGTQLEVHVEPGAPPARTLPAITRIFSAADLSERVKARSLAVFERLARVEAAIHGISVNEVHFHELGAVDSLVDIVGTACSLERMGIGRVYCSPLPLGGGFIETEHGRLPVPAPATLALLAEVGAPAVPGPGATELVTPTGAALLAELAIFRRPTMSVQAVGYGFGTKEFSWPNALRVWLGEELDDPGPLGGDSVVQLACNLDDATAETLGYIMERLLAGGALDVWFTPIQMKKNRPATELTVLVRPQDADRLEEMMLRETPTLGLRRQVVPRTITYREERQVYTVWGAVRVKVKILRGRAVAASPEFDDCARLADQARVPLADVMATACRLAEEMVEAV